MPSFLRKYFVARADEPDAESRACIQSVLDAYEKKPLAKERFSFQDEHGVVWVPIIPDVRLSEPIHFTFVHGKGDYIEPDKLPVYKLKKLDPDFLDKYHQDISGRFMSITNNLIRGNWFQQIAVKMFTWLRKDYITKKISKEIVDDLKERKLMRD